MRNLQNPAMGVVKRPDCTAFGTHILYLDGSALKEDCYASHERSVNGSCIAGFWDGTNLGIFEIFDLFFLWRPDWRVRAQQSPQGLWKLDGLSLQNFLNTCDALVLSQLGARYVYLKETYLGTGGLIVIKLVIASLLQ
jgi:hypothetical protein